MNINVTLLICFIFTSCIHSLQETGKPGEFTIIHHAGSEDEILSLAKETCIKNGYVKLKLNEKPKQDLFSTWVIENFSCISQKEVDSLAIKDRENRERESKKKYEEREKVKQKEREKIAFMSGVEECISDTNRKKCLKIFRSFPEYPDGLSQIERVKLSLMADLILCRDANKDENPCSNGLNNAIEYKFTIHISYFSKIMCEKNLYKSEDCVIAYKFSDGKIKSKYFEKAAQSSFRECSMSGSEASCLQLVELSDCTDKTPLCKEVVNFSRRYAEIQVENNKNRELLEIKMGQEEYLAQQQMLLRQNQHYDNLRIQNREYERRVEKDAVEMRAWQQLSDQVDKIGKQGQTTRCRTTPDYGGGYSTRCTDY